MECEYCKKILSSLSSLNTHKATAKYCLKIQNSKNETFICTFCEDIFETKNDLALHAKDCKYLTLSAELKNKDITIQNLQEKINELENELEKLSLTTIKLVNNIQPMIKVFKNNF